MTATPEREALAARIKKLSALYAVSVANGSPHSELFATMSKCIDELAALASPAAGGVQARCTCGEKLASECAPDDEWGPNCDLGNNAKFVRRAATPPADPAPVDWSHRFTVLAGSILTDCGIAHEVSTEPGVDRLRDKIAQRIQREFDAAPTQAMPQADLIADLLRSAAECEAAGVAGWGNVMRDAAAALASQEGVANHD